MRIWSSIWAFSNFTSPRSSSTNTVGPLAPGEAQPAERPQDRRLRGGRRARAIRVLDPQHELSAVLLGEGVIEERDVGGADVRIAGGRRRDADSDGGRHAPGFITWT